MQRIEKCSKNVILCIVNHTQIYAQIWTHFVCVISMCVVSSDLSTPKLSAMADDTGLCRSLNLRYDHVSCIVFIN